MDRQLERYLPERAGFFVEAGGNDGYTQSNTYALERRHGWRGVLVEPVPELARACARERPASRVVRAALVPEGFADAEVGLRFGGLMTVVVGAREGDDEWVAAAHAVGQEEPPHDFRAPARTLSSILDEVQAPEVDLLSLDVEGYEAEVLAGLDLERHAPRFVLVEMRDIDGERGAIDAILGERYIDVDALSPFDVLYARADVARSLTWTRARRTALIVEESEAVLGSGTAGGKVIRGGLLRAGGYRRRDDRRHRRVDRAAALPGAGRGRALRHRDVAPGHRRRPHRRGTDRHRPARVHDRHHRPGAPPAAGRHRGDAHRHHAAGRDPGHGLRRRRGLRQHARARHPGRRRGRRRSQRRGDADRAALGAAAPRGRHRDRGRQAVRDRRRHGDPRGRGCRACWRSSGSASWPARRASPSPSRWPARRAASGPSSRCASGCRSCARRRRSPSRWR